MRKFCTLITSISIIGLLGACSNPTEIVRHEPEIHSITLERTIVYVSDSVGLSAKVSDADEDDTLTFRWSATGGEFVSEKNNPTQWRSPGTPGKYSLTLVLSDGYYQTSKSVEVTVRNR